MIAGGMIALKLIQIPLFRISKDMTTRMEHSGPVQHDYLLAVKICKCRLS